MSELRNRLLKLLKESNISFMKESIVKNKWLFDNLKRGDITINVLNDDRIDETIDEVSNTFARCYEVELYDFAKNKEPFWRGWVSADLIASLLNGDPLPEEYEDNVNESLKESPIDYVGTVSENSNGKIDVLTMDIPLFLRLLEYAKEDAKTDLDLHYVSENALKCMQGKDKLSMDCYENIIPSEEQTKEEEPEEEVE